MTTEVPFTPVITFEELRQIVDKYVELDNMSYSESIVELCTERGINVEDIAKIIRGPLKAKLEAEAMDRNVIKRTTAYLM
tara:strand:- start:2763 stop:3002 length:240 start_codon:yes stop_codon:yes gene_type:complete